MKSSLSISFILFFFLQNLCGQSHSFEQLTTLDGLPSNHIYDILTDKKGYTWFATDRGVCKYDGHNFKIFTAKDGLTSNDIWQLYEDAAGRIWLRSFAKETLFIEDDSVKIAGKNNAIGRYSNYMEANNVVYSIYGYNTLQKYQDGVIESIIFPYDFTKPGQSIALNHLKALRLNVDSFSIIDCTIDPPDAKRYKNLDEINKHAIDKFIAFSDIRLFVNKDCIFTTDAKYTFLYRWDYSKNTIITYDLSQLWPQGIDYLIPRKYKNGVQITTNSGYAFFDENLNLLFSYELLGIELTGHADYVYGNPNGDAFVVYKGDGCYILPRQKQYCVQRTISDKNIKVECIVPSPSGGLLVGMSDGSVFQRDNDRIFQKIPTSATLDDKVRNIFFLEDKFWVVKQSVTFSLYDKTLTHKINIQPSYSFNDLANEYMENQYSQSFINLENNNFLQASTKDVYYHPNLKWMSFASGGYTQVFLHKAGQWHINYYPLIRQYCTAITNDSIIWSGGPSGLSYIYRDSIHLLQDEHPLYAKKTDELLVDQYQNVWVGTDGYGLYCYQKDIPIQVKGCEDDIIIAMCLDQAGNIWVSTNHGIKQIIMEDGRPQTAMVHKTYTTADGLSVNSPTAIYVADSILYAGSYKGLDELNLAAFERNAVSPRIYMINIEINDLQVSDRTFFNLSHAENNIKINFSGISYKSKRGLKYRYFLQNHTPDTLFTEDNNINFTSLLPSHYKLTLFAEDETGLRSQAILRTFHITQPWYNTIWAYLLYLLGIIGGVFFIVRYYHLKTQAKKDVEKRMAELELHALQSQMNPHFIFNALNAIRQYQTENNTEEADKYFNDFATLMRLYLESSKMPVISLEDELKLLRIYIGLEQLRFSNKFESNINISPDLEPRYIKIPSMLLQPFVENAINHGLFHKEDKGFIDIKIREETEQIRIIITDDGIGRKAAKEIREKSMNNYKSRTLQITEERIAVLKKQQNVSIDITIHDLFDEDGQPNGTRVEIVIPEIF